MDRAKVDRLKALLGSWSEHRGPWSVVARSSQDADSVAVEHLIIQRDGADQIPALLCRPSARAGRGPAVLYAHAHGNRHDIGRRELTDGRPAIADPPYGPTLARRGFVVLCVEMPTFGDRASESEGARAKARLWQGGTLFGDMLCDLALGLDVLEARDDVDPSRIAALGLSMGATHAYWLAALDARIAAVAHLCSFASLSALVATGEHDLHGPYMTVPGLLREFDTGVIAGLVAPRPQLVCVGLKDPLTPGPAFERAWRDAVDAYRRAGAEDRLDRIVESDGGHLETRRMRAAVLDFLDTRLRTRRDRNSAGQ